MSTISEVVAELLDGDPAVSEGDKAAIVDVFAGALADVARRAEDMTFAEAMVLQQKLHRAGYRPAKHPAHSYRKGDRIAIRRVGTLGLELSRQHEALAMAFRQQQHNQVPVRVKKMADVLGQLVDVQQQALNAARKRGDTVRVNEMLLVGKHMDVVRQQVADVAARYPQSMPRLPRF